MAILFKDESDGNTIEFSVENESLGVDVLDGNSNIFSLLDLETAIEMQKNLSIKIEELKKKSK